MQPSNHQVSLFFVEVEYDMFFSGALARSGAPWVRKFGNRCIHEILVAFLLAKPLSDLDNPDCLDFPVSWNKNLK